MIDLPAVGDLFADKYKIGELLGRGGNAAVFRATDEAMSRDVAVKIVVPDEDGYPAAVVGRFMREGRVLAGLMDPHNITMFDFGKTDDGLLYMVFEFVDGRELGAFLDEEGPLEPRVVAHIMDQLLQGLEEAHQAGILHRDVKPANIMVFEYANDPYRVKLLDFGIARPASASEQASAVTSEGMVVGTPRYMAPEQMLGGELTPSSDLFSLGLVAFELLTGRPAFDGASARELTKQQFAPTPLRLPDGIAPPVFCRLIERMVARDADARPKSALVVLQQMRTMKRELGRWAGMEHATTAPHGAVHRAPPETASASPAPPRRGRRFLVLAAIALVIGAVIAIVILRQLEPAPTPPARPIDTTQIGKLMRDSAKPAPKAQKPASVDLGSSPATDAATVAPGCGGRAEPGVETIDVDTSTGMRTSAVHIPKGYDGQTPLPVVVLLHRSVADGPKMLRDSKMGDLADEHGFVVLSPTSENEFEVAWREKTREAAFIRQLVATAASAYCLDLSRIYFIGEGRGGEFAEDLECLVPVSAIATTLSGETEGDASCEIDERRVPRIRIYGDADRYVPAEGGKGCLLFGETFRSATEIEKLSKQRLGCSGRTRKWFDEPGGTCRTWTCDVPFVHCQTTGGHDWPSAPSGADFPGCEEARPRTRPVPYGPLIWKFFAEFGQPLDEASIETWRTNE